MPVIKTKCYYANIWDRRYEIFNTTSALPWPWSSLRKVPRPSSKGKWQWTKRCSDQQYSLSTGIKSNEEVKAIKGQRKTGVIQAKEIERWPEVVEGGLMVGVTSKEGEADVNSRQKISFLVPSGKQDRVCASNSETQQLSSTEANWWHWWDQSKNEDCDKVPWCCCS